ncbi:MAG: chemotaxis protein CheW [Coleofasciculus sp. B1-GNL1-01]|uniref:chemotaxis protein CheW n=1 Tax=Coleofasciculus sp. B1-GNL1-01 TaxID=3068484 RepID=UPI003302CE42
MTNSLDSILLTTSLDSLTLKPLPPETQRRLLRFPLSHQDSALLPLEQIGEVLRVNVRDILPVPEMPGCVLGICNWRGDMLWLVDLSQLLGYLSLDQQGQLADVLVVLVVQVNEQSIGLVVSQVNDIEYHNLQHLQPAVPGVFPPKLLPFILGSLPEDQGIVLNVNAISHYPLWQRHRE